MFVSMANIWNILKWAFFPIASGAIEAQKASRNKRYAEVLRNAGYDESQISDITTEINSPMGSTLPDVLGIDNSSSMFGSLANKYTGAGLTGAEQEANAFSAQEAEKARAWEERMSNTSYQRMVVDMQKAGVNPAMAMSSGQIGTPSSPSPSSVSPVGGNMSDLLSLVLAPLQARNIKAQTANIEADTQKKVSETKGIDIDNSWKDYLNGLDAESTKARTSLTRSEEKQIYQNIDESVARISKMREETKSEKEKQLLYQSERCLNDAKAWQIKEMMPYDQALSKAKTDAEIASASLAFVQAAYQKGLIDKGYISALVEKTWQEAFGAGYDTDKKALENIIYEHQNESWLNMPESFVGKAAYDFAQGLGILRWSISGK